MGTLISRVEYHTIRVSMYSGFGYTIVNAKITNYLNIYLQRLSQSGSPRKVILVINLK